MYDCWNASHDLVFFRFSGSQHCGHVHCAYQYREHYHCMDPECNYQVSVSTSSLFWASPRHTVLHGAAFTVISPALRSDWKIRRRSVVQWFKCHISSISWSLQNRFRLADLKDLSFRTHPGDWRTCKQYNMSSFCGHTQPKSTLMKSCWPLAQWRGSEG